MKLDAKELINKVLSNMIIIKTHSGTYDRLSSDGWAGYIDNTTLGISDLTKYHWFIEDHSLWSQQPFIQQVSPTFIIFRTWVINSTTNSTVTLLKNANAGAFKLVGIRKLGGVARKLLKALKPLTLGRGWAV